MTLITDFVSYQQNMYSMKMSESNSSDSIHKHQQAFKAYDRYNTEDNNN